MSFSQAIIPKKVIEKFEHARRAKLAMDDLILSEFRPLLVAVTGNPNLKVEATGNAPATDGKTVWLQVPWKLGETLEHDMALCPVKDDDLLSLCPACRIVDEVRSDMWHESAHITEDSFQKMKGHKLWTLIESTFEIELQSLPQDKRDELRVDVLNARTPLEGFKLIDFWALISWNVIEDIYVNRRIYQARPGVEPGMQATTRATFLAETKLERPRDMTALMVPYVIGHGLGDDDEVRSYFADEFLPVFEDARINELVDAVPADSDVGERFKLAIGLLQRLRELGFLPRNQDSLLEEPPPPPPSDDGGEPQPGQGDESEEQEPAESESDDESGDGEASGDGDEESTDDEGEADDGSEDEGDDDADAGSGQADEDEDGEEPDDDSEGGGQGEADEADEGEKPEAFPGGGAPSDEDAGDEGDDASDGGSNDLDGNDESDDEQDGDGTGSGAEASGPTDEDIAKLIEEIEAAMDKAMGHEDNDQNTKDQQEAIEKSIDQADFDEPSYDVMGLQVQEPECFTGTSSSVRNHLAPNEVLMAPALSHLRVVFAENKHTGMTRDLRRGPRLDTRHLHRAGGDDRRIFGRKDIPKQRDWAIVVGVDFTSSNCWNGALLPVKEMAMTFGELLNRLGLRFTLEGHTGLGGYVVHTPIKTFREPWSKKQIDRINKISGVGGNLDGHSMERYRKLAQAERATDKLIVYFTDGELHGDSEQGRILVKNIELCQRLGIKLAAVSYQNDTPSDMGFETIQFDGPQDLPKIIAGLDAILSR